jgi:HAD superfamily hydrolase (TIGR01544 family)
LNYDCDEVEKKKKMLEWWDYMHSLIFDAKITLSSLKGSIRTANIETRDNVDEFIQTLNELKIPLLILSGGFGNVVIELLKDNKILLDNVKVLANTVEFDENENGVKFISETIHMYNKNEAVLYDDEYLARIRDRHNVFVIGDAEGILERRQNITFFIFSH